MKILIIGEYSGFAKNLKNGFDSLGHETYVFQDGDNWKKIDTGSNSHIYPFRKNLKIFSIDIKLSWLLRGFYYFKIFKKDTRNYSNYFDRVLILNYEFIRLPYEFWLPQFSIHDIINVTKRDAKIYLLACGDDYVYSRYLPKFRYQPPQNETINRYSTKRYMRLFDVVKQNIEGVIPVMYDYAIAYRDIQKSLNISVFGTIPLPVSIPEFWTPNSVLDRIVIFHGLNRACKGTEIIVEALNIIATKYPTKVEVIIDGKMPLKKYLELLSRTNIVIDQCYSYSYGMNAIYSMSLGKVVLSGNEPENGIEFNRADIPIINILPNVIDIVEKIEYFIEFPNKITDVGNESREFVKSFHSSSVIAKQYISLFKN